MTDKNEYDADKKSGIKMDNAFQKKKYLVP